MHLPVHGPADLSGISAELVHDLRSDVEGEIRFDAGTRALYATDGSNYRQVPIGVVVPRSVSDVVATVGVCARHGVPVLPRGAGTSLAGQCCNVAVVMDLTKYLHQFLTLDAVRRLAAVRPGIVLDDVRHEAQRRAGLTFGPDPSTHAYCSIGGMIGNDSCGVHAQLAGRTVHNVDSLEVLSYEGFRLRVGATSEEELARFIRHGGRRGVLYGKLKAFRDRYANLIRARYPRIPRRVSGYNNLDQLLPENGFHVARALVGTEGTCVTVLEATLNLIHFSPHASLVLLGYPDIYEAAEHVPRINSFAPIAVEGIDAELTEDIRKTHLHQEFLHFLPPGRGWLMVQFWGKTPAEAESLARRLVQALQNEPHPPTVRLMTNPREMDHLWKLRESGLGATARIPGRPDAWPGWEDSAVAPERLAPYLRDLRALFSKYGYSAALYGHFGQGCIHCRVPFDVRTTTGIAKYRAFMDEATDLILQYGGSFSGEHGDGQSRGEFLPKMYGPELIQAFREFKAIWDPRGMMNPGKLVDALPLDSDLRLGADQRPMQVRTHFRFPEDGGDFARATERCVGVGKCRKAGGQTMCPSYQVTREEEHSTRGRAHLLFEMLQKDTLKGGWRDEHVREALDLCLSCKGCRNDCPMKVDMATYKSEFLSHYYSGRLRPRSAYAFGLIYWWARLGSRVPHLVNIAAHAPLLRTLARWIAGMPQERAVPLFAPRTFRRWFTLRPRPQAEGPRILLWPDTFNDHFHPEVAQAAVEVLETAGYQVTIPQSSVCCGRPLYDYGMLDAAKRRLTHLMRTLQHEIAQGIPIVILEPSCHAVFRDELLNLFPDDPTARRLSELTMQLSEAVEKAPRRQRLAKLTRRAVVHGHCHQKAVLKMDNDRALLESTGLQVEMLSSGCCGMAGSFGFEREHYDVSVKCGEQVLLPAVRNAPADALIVANGFSCREQIQQLTPRRALHLAQVLQMGLREGPLGPAGSHPESGYAPDPRARLRASYARVLGGLGVSLVAFAVVARVRRLVA